MLLTTLNAATQRRSGTRRFARGGVYRAREPSASTNRRIAELSSFGWGSAQSPTVMEPGDYAIRGGIIDIFPPGESGPVRLDLFGDILDGARRFDPVSPSAPLKSWRWWNWPRFPRSFWMRPQLPGSVRIIASNSARRVPMTRSMRPSVQVRKHQGIEHWLPFFHEKLETLFDYLPDATVHPGRSGDPGAARRGGIAIADQYETRRHGAGKPNRAWIAVYKPTPPGLLVYG